jgi:hypothetical protein
VLGAAKYDQSASRDYGEKPACDDPSIKLFGTHHEFRKDALL